MGNRYSKYEEKLSAYLDGMLSPDEMAEISHELETNRDLAERLEEMRRIDDMAQTALPSFDDDILEKLESGIMSRLDTSETPQSQHINTSPQKTESVWFRYVSIAASIAVLFLVGRIAFKEVKKPLLSPARPVIKMERQKSSVVPKSAPDEVKEESFGMQNKQGETVRDKAQLPISKSVHEQTTNPSVDESSSDTEDMIGAEVIIEQRDNLDRRLAKKTSARSFSASETPVPLAGEEKEEAKEEDITTPTFLEKTTTPIEEAPVSQSREEHAGISSLLPLPTIKEADSSVFDIIPLDSLKDIYAMYVLRTKEDSKPYLKEMKTTNYVLDSGPSKAKVLLDSLAQLPGIDNDAYEIESLYLKAKTHYHMYMATRDEVHYREAIAARQRLDDIIAAELKKYPTNARLREYASDIAHWKFDR